MAPSVRYNLIKKLAVQLGPEVNIFLDKQLAFTHSQPVEVGAFTRLSYAVNDLTFQLSTSHGFSPYWISKLVDKEVFELSSTTFQVGVSYRVGHLRL